MGPFVRQCCTSSKQIGKEDPTCKISYNSGQLQVELQQPCRRTCPASIYVHGHEEKEVRDWNGRDVLLMACLHYAHVLQCSEFATSLNDLHDIR
jgi:hypothetical protein